MLNESVPLSRMFPKDLRRFHPSSLFCSLVYRTGNLTQQEVVCDNSADASIPTDEQGMLMRYSTAYNRVLLINSIVTEYPATAIAIADMVR